MIPQQINLSIHINASPAKLWELLTYPALMKTWMGEPEMNLEIITDWKVGSPIVTKGFHHIKFENRGTVLEFEPYKLLRYNYLSSISRLPYTPENYTVLKFELTPTNEGTMLALTIQNFPTEAIYKHLDFYWRTTMPLLKRLIEEKP